MTVIRSHDALFRFVFGEPEQMGELLRSNLPAPVATAIDWATLRRVDGAFVDEELKGRHADLLFEARLGGRPLLLYVLVEHKSGDDSFTALQLLRYVVRVWDRWLESNAQERALPPVLPLVVHHGDRAWNSPRTVTELVDLDGIPEEVAAFLRGLQPQLTFLLDDLAAGTEAGIDERRLSPIADLCLRFLQILRHLAPEQAGAAIVRWEGLLRALLEHARGQDVTAALLYWFLAQVPDAPHILRTVMTRIHDGRTRKIMKSGIDELLEEGFVKGREQGREEGRVRGQRELLRHLLVHRFGTVPAAADARLAACSPADLATWSARVLTAGSVDDVFRAC